MQGGDGIEQLAAVADGGDADLPQVLRIEPGQDIAVHGVGHERRFIVLQADISQSAATPDSVGVGQDVILQTNVTVTQDAALLLDFEVWDSQGQKVWQTWHDNRPLQAGGDNFDSAVFTVPDGLAAGPYHLVVGVFSAGWGTVYAFNSEAATLTVTTD